MELRPYQQECLSSIQVHFRTSIEPVVISISTGGGKTIIFSTLIKSIFEKIDTYRILLIAHRKQLLEQAEDKLLNVSPKLWNRIGIYSAGLKRRDTDKEITIAGIQSVYKKIFDFKKPPDLIIVDEAHNIPADEDTMYQELFNDARTANKNVRILGVTATPYRMKGGSIYGKGQMFTECVFKIGIDELIDQGYLCPVTAKHGKASSDFSKVKLSAGDFNAKEVNLILNDRILVETTVKEILKLAEGRKKVLIFCCSIDHAELVQKVIDEKLYGYHCGITHSKMNKEDRGENELNFMQDSFRFMVNIGVLTEGWDFPAVDCIAIMTATCSPGRYVQMVGRGLRINPGKDNCLVLDFGGNIERHGCIDMVETVMEKKKREKIGKKADAQMCKACPECETMIALASMECLECGYIFPKKDFNHDTEAAEGAIISTEIIDQDKDVNFVMCSVHKKEGKPDSIKVVYWCGTDFYQEWVCVAHEGYARTKAIHWWQQRHTSLIVPSKVSDIDLKDLSDRLTEITKSISVRKNGKYFEIKKYQLDFESLKQTEQGSA